MNKLLFILSAVSLLACAGPEAGSPAHRKTAPDTVAPAGSSADHRPADIYGVSLHDTVFISLQQWDSTVNLPLHLGKPVAEKVRKLDENSDTFSGSYIKDMAYPGLRLQLFSPPQNGRTFWIQEITLTDSSYTTRSGVRLGDDLEKVKKAFPNLQKFPGHNENMFYVADAGYEKSIEMEFSSGRLVSLRMYYSMN